MTRKKVNRRDTGSNHPTPRITRNLDKTTIINLMITLILKKLLTPKTKKASKT
jgi:hypothetical protein